MQLRWTDQAQEDLRRVHYFLAWKNPNAAARVIDVLSQAPDRLLMQPRVGVRIESMPEPEIRRILVGQYEIRYDIVGDLIRVLRIFHMREER